jgi:hypothetical protein
MDQKMAVLNRLQANQSVVPCPGHAKKGAMKESHTTNGQENGKNSFWFSILPKAVCHNCSKQETPTWCPPNAGGQARIGHGKYVSVPL